jgi:2-oxoglutarate ferredoxin oxidoreductase subunit delta
MKLWRQPLDRDRVRIAHGIVHVIDDRCKGCGFCIEFCPRHLLKISDRINAKGYHPPEVVDDLNCTYCGLCALLCPDFAIYVEDGGMRTPEKIIPISKEERAQ